MNYIEHIFVVGFNHHYVDNSERGEIIRLVKEEINESQLIQYNIKALSVLQTCNRWELYGYGDINGSLNFIASATGLKFGDKQLLCLKGMDAIRHIFKVAAGLDSMVLGDQEILSQFKKSFVEAKKNRTIDGYMERLANVAIQAAKEVRKKTFISKGTTSLSYAVIHILKKIDLNQRGKILLIGLGKFGHTILKNLKEYYPKSDLYLCNRTLKKSEAFAKTYDANVLKWENCASYLGNFEVVISAFESKEIHFTQSNTKAIPKNIIDLSMPSPFCSAIKENKSINYYSIDDAANIVNASLENRKSSIPIALKIIEHHVQEFIKWSATYSHSNVLKEWKNKLNEASEICPFFQSMDSKESTYYIQKSMGHFAKFVKSDKAPKESKKVLSIYLQSQHS